MILFISLYLRKISTKNRSNLFILITEVNCEPYLQPSKVSDTPSRITVKSRMIVTQQ